MQLAQEELTLYLQCLNEVLRGFEVENFERMLGASKSELAKEDAYLREVERTMRKGDLFPDVHVRATVIRATMEKLGESEFQTRTGCELPEAQRLVKRLDQTL